MAAVRQPAHELGTEGLREDRRRLPMRSKTEPQMSPLTTAWVASTETVFPSAPLAARVKRLARVR